ncbi:hypothetical protein CRE_19111 [Caenorhabditis remanei]|uniref:Uncharacterized protein n=1 Tax=Caenorhabditis remanei TaxID=31234 RepID=E3MJD1_CAERE|nr:hypothetical protein CRE_19111 [Caenorhabditis remanei]
MAVNKVTHIRVKGDIKVDVIEVYPPVPDSDTLQPEQEEEKEEEEEEEQEEEQEEEVEVILQPEEKEEEEFKKV